VSDSNGILSISLSIFLPCVRALDALNVSKNLSSHGAFMLIKDDYINEIK
jgi:hypothetical protein